MQCFKAGILTSGEFSSHSCGTAPDLHRLPPVRPYRPSLAGHLEKWICKVQSTEYDYALINME